MKRLVLIGMATFAVGVACAGPRANAEVPLDPTVVPTRTPWPTVMPNNTPTVVMTPIPSATPTNMPKATATVQANSPGLTERIDLAWQSRDWPTVLNLLDTLAIVSPHALDIQDKRYVAHLSAGQDYLESGNWPMAVQEWTRATQVSPNRPEAPRALLALTPTPTPAKPTPKPIPPPVQRAPAVAYPPALPRQQLPPACQQYANDLQEQLVYLAKVQALKDDMLRAQLRNDNDTFATELDQLRQLSLSHGSDAMQWETDHQQAFLMACPGVHGF